ncbi:TRAP transporter large permease [uncultured Oscillibacter sp.]|uniref:TRAP transporter large permease n=1 Tax=uncultured Oscillibacter sp. TaxID=876091 RepID=UPI0025D20FCA|nr:TRAP transporter large permease [uncultured Oscillibacter sp.]
MIAGIFILMFALLFLGVPIGSAIGIPVAALIGVTQVTSFEYIAQFLYTKMADFTMLSLPFFLLAGDIMDGGGLSKRMVGIADALIGNVTGALGMITIVACMFFGAVSGSAPATVAAIGTIMVPQMVHEGYDKGYAIGLTCVAGGLGIIVPPSFPMVLYGVTNGVSIGDMFLAGWGPAFVVGAVLIIINYWLCRTRNYKSPIPKETSLKKFGAALWDGKWALFMPVLILGGIYSGAFSPTEAGVVSCVYGLIVGLFLYKELDIRTIIPMFKNKVNFLGGMMFCFAPAGALGAVFAYLGYTTAIKNFFLNISTNPYIIVLLIYAFLFIAGMFVQTAPIIVIISPLLLPVATAVGIDPIHFGIIITLALAVAFVTPPVATNLFVGASMTGISIDKISRAAVPFIAGLVLAEIIVGFVPGISMVMVKLFG